MEKSFIRRVRTGAPAVPILSDYQKYAQVPLQPDNPAVADAPATTEVKEEEDDSSYNNAFIHKMTAALDNKHLHRINSDLMDMIEREQRELKRISKIQKHHEAQMKADDKDAQVVNALLLELVWYHRELIQNLQDVRSDSVHSENQALRLLKKVSKCVKKQ